MNLDTYRTRVRRVSGMSSNAADLALIDSWVNEGIEQFNRKVKSNVKTASMAVTAGTGDYTLDTDILALQGLWYQPADSVSSMLIPMAPEDIQVMRLSASLAHAPRYYALAGAHTLMLYPNPLSSTDQVHMLYVPRHTALSATADTPSATANGNVPPEYHYVIEAYAKWKACESEEHAGFQNGAVFQAEWQQGVASAVMDMKRKAGSVIPAVRIGRPSGRVGWPAGVDFGR